MTTRQQVVSVAGRKIARILNEQPTALSVKDIVSETAEMYGHKIAGEKAFSKLVVDSVEHAKALKNWRNASV